MFKRHGLSLRRFLALHFLVALSLFALWGWIETGNRYLILGAVVAFYGALCFALAGLYEQLDKRQTPK